MILGVDPGLATLGWAIVTPESGAVVACGVLVQKPDPKLTKHADRVRRTQVQSSLLSELVAKHSIGAVAAETMSFAPRAQAAAKIGIGMSWGSLVGLAAAFGIPLRDVSPKTWQRAVVPADVNAGEKKTDAIAYERVYAELARYVDCAQMLADVPQGQRNHALDACGVGVFAAIVPEVFNVKRKERRA